MTNDLDSMPRGVRLASSDEYQQARLSEYESYLRTDRLLALQPSPADWSHREEVLFVIVHQSSELWLKLGAHELEGAHQFVVDGRTTTGSSLVRRAALCLQYITAQLDMLEQMSPWDYHVIRGQLGTGSGFSSPGWQRLVRATAPLGQALRRDLAQNSLSLRDVYVRRTEFAPLYEFVESLVELDQRVTAWRIKHVQTVLRILGEGAVGTAGKPVAELLKNADRRLYPELWQVRATLRNEADGVEAGGQQ